LKRDLQMIEEYLGSMFMPEFAKAIVVKQLQDIGETPETYNRGKLDRLLNQIGTKVLQSFKGDESTKIVRDIKRKILED